MIEKSFRRLGAAATKAKPAVRLQPLVSTFTCNTRPTGSKEAGSEAGLASPGVVLQHISIWPPGDPAQWACLCVAFMAQQDRS